MKMTTSSETENFREKRRVFLGSVKYSLKHLVEDTTANPRQTDQKNIKRLLNIYRLEGCLRLELENHVPAVVSHDQYQRIVATLPKGELQLRDLYEEPPQANLAEDLVCLHGKHRLQAARRFLGLGDKWWIVDLYTDGWSGISCRYHIADIPSRYQYIR